MEQAVNAALQQAFQQAEEQLLARLETVTLAMLSQDFHERLVASGKTSKHLEHQHER